jgi:hypothetical protein
LRRYWIVLSVAAVVVLVLGSYALGERHGARRQNGLHAASHASSVSKELPQAKPAPVSAEKAAAANACADNASGKLLLVSISQQHIWACDGTAMAKDSAVTTGTSEIINGVDDNTPTGSWHIYSKQTNTTLKGCDANGCWNDPVSYWMPYDGAVGFHDASWQTFPFGSDQYKTDGSHGCVHVPLDFISWVYDWAAVGTTVTVIS